MVEKQPVHKETPNIGAEQMEGLRELLPQVFAEGKVDFDKLRESLGDEIDSRLERYSFTWAGKRDAIRLLQTPSRATLVPAKKESIPDKGQSFRICLDEVLKPAAIRALALGKNDLFICRDKAMTDELVANLALQCRLKTI